MAENVDVNWKIPPAIALLRTIRGRDFRLTTYRYIILLTTFIAYACYHASRKPNSIVKSVLDPKLKTLHISRPWPIGDIFIPNPHSEEPIINQGWYPFNRKGGTEKLGEIDVAFLACYSIGMYVAGHLGDSLDLRLFLTFGMIGSGIFVGLFGMGFFWNIHAFYYYIATQMIAGLFQATGWPSVVAVIGNWFGKRKRGLIMGIWNAHTSVGNIAGSLLAASVLDYGWGWSFLLPGIFIAIGGVIVFLFLVPYPEDVGFPSPYGESSDAEAQNEQKFNERRSVGLLEACSIPGVVPFALCLFFSKLVAYTFLYWLPFYLSRSEIGGKRVSVKSAGNLSTLFDVGGIIGGILAGHISDKLKARAITSSIFMFLAIPAMILYRLYGGVSMYCNIGLMVVAGLFVNGPYALITTAVSADLGTHSSLRGNSRALATVTAIIDGTGSLGAVLGPLLTGFLVPMGWDAVFSMLVVGAVIAGLIPYRQVADELCEKMNRPSRPEDLTSEPLIIKR